MQLGLLFQPNSSPCRGSRDLHCVAVLWWAVVTLQIVIDNCPILRCLPPSNPDFAIVPGCQRVAQLANQLLQPRRAKIACQTRARVRDRAALWRPAQVCSLALHFHESFRPVCVMHKIMTYYTYLLAHRCFWILPYLPFYWQPYFQYKKH